MYVDGGRASMNRWPVVSISQIAPRLTIAPHAPPRCMKSWHSILRASFFVSALLARTPVPGVLLACTVLVGVLFAGTTTAEDDLADSFQVPDGFEVTLFADNNLAHNVYSMAIDSHGRVAVSGPGYVKTLIDDDKDGRADRALTFCDFPKSGAQGLYFDGPNLLLTGDGALRYLRDADGDGRADGEGEVWAELANPEHGAHAIRKGPDGWFYVVCGNNAGVGTRHITDSRSPVDRPRSGAILRFSPDGKRSEVFAHGFRNPYDLAFNGDGRLFTVDSDGERAHHLPWYTPTRLFDVGAGAHHGWLEVGWRKNWARPEYFFDNVERAAELGRGSPTGLACYRHRQFPAPYRGGIFSACWTLGRVYFIRLSQSGASYTSDAETFMQTTGAVGFAPVDLAVGPDGDLFVAIGGRGTRGGVFRVRHRNSDPAESHPAVPADSSQLAPLDRVLSAPQPLANWSRAHWEPQARKLGREAFEQAAVDPKRGRGERCRAVEILVDLFGGPRGEFASSLIDRDDDDGVIARLAWALGRREADGRVGLELLSRLTRHQNLNVRRAAWEALLNQSAIPSDLEPGPDFIGAMDLTSRRIRAAAIAVARTCGADSFRRFVNRTPGAVTARQRLSRLWVNRSKEPGSLSATEDYFNTCLEVFDTCDDAAVRLEALRLMQIGLGDVVSESDGPTRPTGYIAADRDRIGPELRGRLAGRLAPAFPTREHLLDIELSRLLAMLETENDKLLMAIAAQWSNASSPVDDVHYLIVLSMLRGPRTQAVTRRTADSLVTLHAKLEREGRSVSRTWPLEVGDAFDRLVRLDPALFETLTSLPDFGRSEHSLFASRMEGPQRATAARRILAAAESDDDRFRWSGELVEVLASLPHEEAHAALRRQWQNPAVADAITKVMSRRPRPEDRPRFIEALDSLQPEVARSAAVALGRLDRRASAAEVAVAIRALRRNCALQDNARLARATRPLRESLAALLEHWSGESFDVDEPDEPAALPASYARWFDWFEARYPMTADGSASGTERDPADWQARIAGIEFDLGDAARGEDLFAKQNCRGCHEGNGRLGPALGGAIARLDREDLFAKIVEPNRDVSPGYATVALLTKDGRVYHGMVVYQSPEGTLLQTGADTAVRVTDGELEAILPSRRSMMPTGLLEGLSDAQIADLYAYLRTLDASPQGP